MKVTLLEASGLLKTKGKIIEFMQDNFPSIKFSINSDLSVDVTGDVKYILKKPFPIQFGKVTGNFYCSNNDLVTLKGAPKEVGGGFYCSYNKLINLEGAPKVVGGSFHCFNNNLITLKGAPKEVNSDFYCHNNKLTSLKGAPKEVDGHFDCSNNARKFLRTDVEEVCKVTGLIYI